MFYFRLKMNNSREELLEMEEIKSPFREKLRAISKKKNKIHSPPFASPSHRTDNDVTSLFSVKKAFKISDISDNTGTISEMSDDIFSESSISGNKSIRGKHRLSRKMKQIDESLEQIYKQCKETDSKFQRIRHQYPSKQRKDTDKVGFFLSEQDEEENDENDYHSDNKLTIFNKAQELRLHVEAAEGDLFFTPNKRPLQLTDKILKLEVRNMSAEGFFVYINRDISKMDLNILEKRLLSVDDKQWFNCDGNMLLLPNPLVHRSIKSCLKIKREGLSYKAPSPNVDLEEIVIIQEHILEVSLSYVKFFHHPLFSLEHVLEQSLRQVYDKYSTSLRTNKLQKLKNQMEALKHAKKLKKDEAAQTRNIKQIREDLLSEGKCQRNCLKSILDFWKCIKKLRREQNYSVTCTRLIIKKEPVDVRTETETYEQYFGEFLEDVLDEYRRDFRRKMRQYNRKLRAREEALSTEQSDSEEHEESIIDEPVYDVDEEKVERDLRKRFEESFRPPGEPKLTLFLRDDNEVTWQVDDLEDARRKVVSSTKLLLKIFCDGMFVCKTKPVHLNDGFVLDLNEIFSIQLNEIPKCLTVEFIELPKGLLKKKICDINLKLPNLTEHSGNFQFKESHFEKREIVHYKHAGVGSGFEIKKLLVDAGIELDLDLLKELNTTGSLKYAFRWTVPANKSIPTERESIEFKIPNVLNKWGAIDKKQLECWLEGQKPDPQDPKNSPFFEYLSQNDFEDFERDRKEYFRLSPYADTLKFCKMPEIDCNVRLLCLKLRDRNEIEFDGLSIPNRSREVALGPLRDFKRRKAIEVIEEDDDDENDGKDGGKRRLKQIYTKIFQMCKGSDNNLSYESVVDEKYLIYVEQFIQRSLNNFLNWFRARPKLNKPMPKIETNRSKPKREPYTKIIIKVICAKNAPKRQSGEDVRLFLQIVHEEYLVKTNVESGCNPFWNELVELSLHCGHAEYLNPNALNSTILVNVFDLIEAPASDDETELIFWLGDIKIPLVALTTGLGLQGWFKVNKPTVLLGYETSVLKSSENSFSSTDTYIQMELSICPSIPLLEPNMNDIPSNEVPYMKEHILGWNEWFNNCFPSKKFHVLAIDSHKRTNCLTRYIRPLEPPQIDTESFEVTPEQYLRYVSLIPFIEVNGFYQNVWLTTEQLLNYNIGTVVDHCVALACFLLALKLEAWLLLGFGLPHGNTAYVLTCEYVKETKEPTYFLLDVVGNLKVGLQDPLCPLQKVFCLVNGYNIWANIQRTDNPALLRFDLTRGSDWSSLFDSNVSSPTTFVNNKVNFVSVIDIDDLERQLERKIKRKISKWRTTNRTIFSHRVSDTLRIFLKTLEHNAMFGKNNSEVVLEISKAFLKYSVAGICLNLPFVGISRILKQIKQTNLHNQSSEITDFALGVKMKSYPGQVISVFIFLGALLEKPD